MKSFSRNERSLILSLIAHDSKEMSKYTVVKVSCEEKAVPSPNFHDMFKKMTVTAVK